MKPRSYVCWKFICSCSWGPRTAAWIPEINALRPHRLPLLVTTGVRVGIVGPGPTRPWKAPRAHDGAQEKSPPFSGNASKGFRSWKIADRSGKVNGARRARLFCFLGSVSPLVELRPVCPQLQFKPFPARTGSGCCMRSHHQAHQDAPLLIPCSRIFFFHLRRLFLSRNNDSVTAAANFSPHSSKPRSWSRVGIITWGRLVGRSWSVARNGAHRGRRGVHMGSQRLGPGEKTPKHREGLVHRAHSTHRLCFLMRTLVFVSACVLLNHGTAAKPTHFTGK